MTARSDTFYGGQGYGDDQAVDRFLLWGTGTPEAVVTAGIGALFSDISGGVIYIKATGSGNTGWVVIQTGSGGPGIIGPEFFGAGYDGDVALDGSTAAPSWASKSSGVYTLNRDVYCRNLTLTGTAQIALTGCRLFCSGILDVSAAVASTFLCISSSYTGGAASGATAGAGGPTGGLPSIILHGLGNRGAPGGAGGPDGVSGGGNGSNATLNTPSTTCITTLAGGKGGTGDSAAGNGGTLTTTTNGWLVDRPIDWIAQGASPVIGTLPGSGGGGGGGAGTGVGGAGGGGGGGVGIIWIAAHTINRASGIRCVDARGGVGGAGANGAVVLLSRDTGGGGGGAGGGGGLVYMFYQTLTGSTGSSTFIDASGGNGGHAGDGSTPGGTANGGGTGGTGGPSGLIVLADFTAGTVTVPAGPLTAGTVGNGPSGTNNVLGGIGGLGASYSTAL